MEKTQFYGCIAIMMGFIAWVLQMITGGTMFSLLPLTLLVVPAIFAGLDLWHWLCDLAKNRTPLVDQEGALIFRFFARWLVVSLPPAAVLFALHQIMPDELTLLKTNFDAWRSAMSIVVVYGLFNLPVMQNRELGFSVAYIVRWFKESHGLSAKT